MQTRFATTALALSAPRSARTSTPAIDRGRRRAIDEELDDELVAAEQYAFLGAGWTVGLAHEAALKMREASQSWTESYPAKEYRHGPIAIAAPGRVTWMFGEAPAGPRRRRRRRPAPASRTAAIDGMADLVRAQRVALARARRAGLDPDSPRNLTRSVILAS